MDLQSSGQSTEIKCTGRSILQDFEKPTYEVQDSADEPPRRKIATEEANASREGYSVCVSSHIYNPVLEDRPRCQSPNASSSGESMNNNNENFTPPASPSPSGSSGGLTAHRIARLSLEDQRRGIVSGSRGRGSTRPSGLSPAKRTASSELNGQRTRKSPEWQRSRHDRGNTQRAPGPYRHDRSRGNKVKQNVRPHQDIVGSNRTPRPQSTQFSEEFIQSESRDPGGHVMSTPPTHKDSGYVSAPASRKSTARVWPSKPNGYAVKPASSHPLSAISEKPPTLPTPEQKRAVPEPARSQNYPGLILQPESSPISRDQLAAEVKGIYAGLAMVEAKCINIDDAQAKTPQSRLEPDQWQALIALHRTLLYEHHDFLMATQHPSATEALRGFARKYNMPARMWKHGIHAFLEVLRHRRPESQDYMLAFIYLAYQMIALFYETVPTFLDTWIECLGDLARYRMAIEEEREAHVTWGAVAARWYRKAADRNPETGRLNHHLGILERPSLRKLFLYAKSLTCILPFINAKDSLATLCGPIVLDEENGQHNNYTTEARIVSLYALLYSAPDDETIPKVEADALIRLESTPTSRIRDIGPELVVTGVAFLLQLGSHSNYLWQLFAQAVNNAVQTSRPSNGSFTECPLPFPDPETHQSFDPTFAIPLVYRFLYGSFNTIIRKQRDPQSLQDVLSTVHAMLAWVHGAYTVWSQNNINGGSHTFGSLFCLTEIAWGELSDFMNKLSQIEPISARTVEFARQGMFLTPERAQDARPLPEDFSLRGLIWTKFYYPSAWFDGLAEDDGRSIETAQTHRSRIERVQWLCLYLSFRIEHLKVETNSRSFFAPACSKLPSMNPVNPETTLGPNEAIANLCKPPSWPSAIVSEQSDSEGYTVVTSSKSKTHKSSTGSSPRLSKTRENHSPVKVFDEYLMQWEQCE